MSGDLVIGSESPDTKEEVLKYKVNKKRMEIEEKLRAVLASDLINVRQYVGTICSINTDILVFYLI